MPFGAAHTYIARIREYPLPSGAQGEVKAASVKSIWILSCLRGSFSVPITWETGKIGNTFGSCSKRVWRSAPKGPYLDLSLVVLRHSMKGF